MRRLERASLDLGLVAGDHEDQHGNEPDADCDTRNPHHALEVLGSLVGERADDAAEGEHHQHGDDDVGRDAPETTDEVTQGSPERLGERVVRGDAFPRVDDATVDGIGQCVDVHVQLLPRAVRLTRD